MDVERALIENLEWLERKSREFCRGREDAEDLCYETILKILIASPRFRNGALFRPWAYRIMANTCKTWLRRGKLVSFYPLDESYMGYSEIKADSDVLCREILVAVRAIAKRNVCGSALVLHMAGYNAMEIADLLAIPIGTARQRLCTARKMIYNFIFKQERL